MHIIVNAIFCIPYFVMKINFILYLLFVVATLYFSLHHCKVNHVVVFF